MIRSNMLVKSSMPLNARVLAHVSDVGTCMVCEQCVSTQCLLSRA